MALSNNIMKHEHISLFASFVICVVVVFLVIYKIGEGRKNGGDSPLVVLNEDGSFAGRGQEGEGVTLRAASRHRTV